MPFQVFVHPFLCLFVFFKFINCVVSVVWFFVKTNTDYGAKGLCQLLKIPNVKIRILDLHYNHITEKGAMILAKGLKINKSLQELDLSHNSLGFF